MAPIKDTEIVIIGGGAVGVSIAYHLARRGSRNLTRLMRNSVELYETLEVETGLATDWKPGVSRGKGIGHPHSRRLCP